MARLGLGAQVLSRCRPGLVKVGPVVTPLGAYGATTFCASVRRVSTTRPKKAQAMKEAPKEASTSAPVSKAKAPKASTATKTKKATAKAAPASELVAEGTKPTKKARVTKPKSTVSAEAEAEAPARASVSRKRSSAKAGESVTPETPPTSMASLKASSQGKAEPMNTSAVGGAAVPPQNRSPPTAPSPARFSPSKQIPQSGAPQASAAPAASSVPPSPPPPASKPVPPKQSGNAKPKFDTNSPEYKQAAWRWTSTVIALPILLVTSYFLFDRLALGNNPSLEQIRQQIRNATTGQVASTEVASSQGTSNDASPSGSPAVTDAKAAGSS